jgi:hypothetical protein
MLLVQTAMASSCSSSFSSSASTSATWLPIPGSYRLSFTQTASYDTRCAIARHKHRIIKHRTENQGTDRPLTIARRMQKGALGGGKRASCITPPTFHLRH